MFCKIAQSGVSFLDIMLERILSLIPKKDDGKFVHGALKSFANSIGLKSGNLVSDWMAGRSSSYESYVYEIAEKYNVSVEWLRGETDIKEKPTLSGEQISEARKQLYAALDDMTDEELLFLMSKIKAIKEMRK